MSVVDRLRSVLPGSGEPGEDDEGAVGVDAVDAEAETGLSWLRPAAIGLLTGVVSLLVVVAPVVLTWLVEPIAGGTVRQAAGTGAALWLLGSGAHLSLGPLTVSLVPLLALAVNVLIARRGAREVLDGVTTDGEYWRGTLPVPLAVTVAAWFAGYAAAVALAVGLTTAGPFRVTPLSLVVPFVLVPLAAVVLSLRPLVLDEPDVLGPRLQLSRVPDLVRRGLRPGLAGAGALLAVGALVVLAAVAVSWGEVSTISDEVAAAGFGGVMLALAQLAYLPNVALWALSFLAGPGFQVVEGGSITWSGAEGGLLPMVPVLAALPQPGAFPWFVPLSVLAVVAVGHLIGRRALREVARLSRVRTKAAVALSACVTAALVVAGLDVLAGGSVGQFRLSSVGAPELTLFLALLVELSVGAVVAVLRDAWTLRR